MNKERVWTAVMALGLMMTVGAAGIIANDALTAKRAGQRSGEILAEIRENAASQALAQSAESTGASKASEAAAPSDASQAAEAPASPFVTAERGEISSSLPELMMPTFTVDGEEYIAILFIPSLELELPVMGRFSYRNLKKAPVRYYGSIGTSDLVICAHNYEAHFGRLKELTPGDTLSLMDMNGTTYTYEVRLREVIEPTAIEAVTSGADDLVLLTCTVGGSARVVVRCSRTE